LNKKINGLYTTIAVNNPRQKNREFMDNIGVKMMAITDAKTV
jgi:hypothetical protein